jgi:hypothetical protein
MGETEDQQHLWAPTRQCIGNPITAQPRVSSTELSWEGNWRAVGERLAVGFLEMKR